MSTLVRAFMGVVGPGRVILDAATGARVGGALWPEETCPPEGTPVWVEDHGAFFCFSEEDAKKHPMGTHAMRGAPVKVMP